jgi:selenocysteine lyase/cysteine desulfurase
MLFCAESQERKQTFKNETLIYLKSAATAKANAATATANASNDQANAARIQTIIAMTKESERLSQKCKDFTKVFVRTLQ